MVKSIAKLFESLDGGTTELIKADLIDSPSSELAGMSTIERGEFCFEQRIKGFKVKQLSEKYDVDSSTIYRWIKDYLNSFARDFESQTRADVLMEELVFLEHIQEVGLYEIQQADFDVVELRSGKLVKTSESRMVKLQFLRLILQIRKMRQDLLVIAGIIPKQAEKIYHKMIDEKATAGDARGATERTPEQIKDNIYKLLRECRALPSND